MRLASSSVPDRRKEPLLLPPNTSQRHTPAFQVSLPGISAGCGSFTGHMNIRLRLWSRPWQLAGRRISSFWRTVKQPMNAPGTFPPSAAFVGPRPNSCAKLRRERMTRRPKTIRTRNSHSTLRTSCAILRKIPLRRRSPAMPQPRIHNAMELEALVQQMGFLPFFFYAIPNFSIEEFTPSR